MNSGVAFGFGMRKICRGTPRIDGVSNAKPYDMYALEVKAKAQKQVESLPKKDQKRVLAAFEVLKESPTAGKQLEGKYKGFRSLRVWPYRILYAIDHSIITVTVVKVGHRKNVYR